MKISWTESYMNMLKKVFLRDNHAKYRRYCDEWIDNLTDGQWKQIKIWKDFEDSGNLKKININIRMTQQEKFTFDEYGTPYPCCGNCESIRRARFKLMCKRYETFRVFDDIKCSEYLFKEWIPCLFDDLK